MSDNLSKKKSEKMSLRQLSELIEKMLNENSKNIMPHQDHEATMAKAEIRDMVKNAKEIYKLIKEGDQLPGWISAYITLASDYMHSVSEYMIEKQSGGEELNEAHIDVNGKTVKTYTQNGDTSYNVTFDDGTKETIYVNNDGWDEINQLHRNAIGDDAYRKQFDGSRKKIEEDSDGAPKKLTMSQFAEWLGLPADKVELAIEITRMSDADGAYAHLQDMGEDEAAEAVEAIYFEHGSLKEAISACKEDLGL